MQGGRKLSDWNIFVKKVYAEGKANDSSYEFKDALKDASSRKSEMSSMKSVTASGVKKSKKSRKSKKSKNYRKRNIALSGGTRKRRRH
jgi:hypothetical protein